MIWCDLQRAGIMGALFSLEGKVSLQYYRFFPGDYARDTRHLSMMQQGAYRLLIDEYMVHGPLPNDLQRLYRICSAFSAEERSAIEFVLSEFFQLDGPCWRHHRCDREIEWQMERSKSAKESARLMWESKRSADDKRTHKRTQSERISARYANQNQNQIQNQRGSVVGLDVDVDLSLNRERESAKRTAKRRGAPLSPVLDTKAINTWIHWAEEERADIDARTALDKFVAHYTASGEIRVDWFAQWKKWVIQERVKV